MILLFDAQINIHIKFHLELSLVDRQNKHERTSTYQPYITLNGFCKSFHKHTKSDPPIWLV